MMSGAYRFPAMESVIYGRPFTEALKEEVERADAHAVFVLASGTLARETGLVDALKALDRRKSTFIATLSHELHTPLTSIADYTEILADAEAGPLTPKQQQILDTISRNTARLRNLIENPQAPRRLPQPRRSHPRPD